MAQEAIGPPPEETLSLWKREQALLKARVVDQDTEAWQRDPAFAGLQRVGGVDVSFVKGDSVRACASLVVLSYPELEVLYEDSRLVHLTAPYLSGFLAFREAPFLADAVRRLREEAPSLAPQAGPPGGWKRGAPPPRLRGGLPPGRPHRPALRRGGQEAAAGGRAGEGRPAPGPDPPPARRRRLLPADRPLRGRAGPGPDPLPPQALRSHDGSSKPLYISVGHKMSLETAVRLTRSCCRFRVPEPVRQVPTWVWPVWLSG
ncbi:endonuclease V isoform X10 [Pipistrellus kuhlii]|uniref:endonuclease V isoform X10 n=1 Tax=Pipistrellus kuhlii TaxID=59472 RepID=UPI001E271E1D|nr:endonuclease V isoform X10 [Pipistrellus kuhlii]